MWVSILTYHGLTPIKLAAIRVWDRVDSFLQCNASGNGPGILCRTKPRVTKKAHQPQFSLLVGLGYV